MGGNTVRLRRHAASLPQADEAYEAENAQPRARRCSICLCLAITVIAFATLVFLGLLTDAVLDQRPLTQGLVHPFSYLNFVFMRLARDVSRAKSRQRRFNQRYALVPLLLGKEEPLPLGDPDNCVGCITLTREELAEFDGRQLNESGEKAPLFLSILGRIYDVSAGKAFYGPGRSYYKLVGKDASRAFCTGCLEPACLISSLDGLSPEQRREADRWIELYEWHDKYKLVGRLRDDPLAPEEEEWLVAEAQEVESQRTFKPFRKR